MAFHMLSAILIFNIQLFQKLKQFFCFNSCPDRIIFFPKLHPIGIKLE